MCLLARVEHLSEKPNFQLNDMLSNHTNCIRYEVGVFNLKIFLLVQYIHINFRY